jgi:hypothetical protein
LHSRKGREGAGIPGAVGVVAGKGLDEDLGSWAGAGRRRSRSCRAREVNKRRKTANS